jgi:hypothetical protein
LDLNRSYGARWMEAEIAANVLEDSAFGVDLVQPVDLYQRAERAVKYAGVFCDGQWWVRCRIGRSIRAAVCWRLRWC